MDLRSTGFFFLLFLLSSLLNTSACDLGLGGALPRAPATHCLIVRVDLIPAFESGKISAPSAPAARAS